MIKTPNVQLINRRIYDSANGTPDDGRVKWWHLELASVKRLGTIKCRQALDCIVRIRYRQIGEANWVTVGGRWVTEAIKEPDRERTLRYREFNQIPIARKAKDDRRLKEGTARARVAYITDTEWFVSGNPTRNLDNTGYEFEVDIIENGARRFHRQFILENSDDRLDTFAFWEKKEWERNKVIKG